MSIAIESAPLLGSKIEAGLTTSSLTIRPLDQSIFKPTTEQLDLLRSTLHTGDDEELRKHVFDVQKEAYEEFPYPCIRLFTYLTFYISIHPVYQEVLAAGREKQETLFLDVGCCMGSDSRKLVFDGYPGKNVHATDLHARFLDLGQKLFNDKDSCEIKFFPADIFALPVTRLASSASDDPGSADSHSPLVAYLGRVTHIYTGLFFHLFDEPTQKEVARRLAVLLNPQPGSIIFGSHAGNEPAGTYILPPDRVRFGHSPSSFAELWHAVFAEIKDVEFANEHVKVEAIMRDSGDFFEEFKGLPVLIWSVKIV